MRWYTLHTQSSFRKKARLAAIGWTLLIFLLCFLPANEVPHISVPFFDKWVHFVLFGVFSFLWLCAYPSREWKWLVLIFCCGLGLGWLVECLQGLLVFLGRSKDIMDALADGVGSLLGVICFRLILGLAVKKMNARDREPLPR